MGAIQSSINQALSVGAFLASQSDILKARHERITGLKRIGQTEALQKERASDIEEARANIESDAAVLTDEGLEYRFTPEQEKSLEQLDVKERQLLGEQATTAAEKYKLDPTRENYFGSVEADIKVAEEEQRLKNAAEQEKIKQRKAEDLQKAERAKKDRRNERDRINRAVERALRKREAQEALANRRQEMGDKLLIGGVEFTSEHPLYKKVQEQLQKEEQ